jgi:hypothetical protein
MLNHHTQALYQLGRKTLFYSGFVPFECGDGWFRVLQDFIVDMDTLLYKHPNEFNAWKESEGKVSQVKEKFGELRIYLRGDFGSLRGKVLDLIDTARERSIETCEVCGEPGRTRGFQVLKTLCDDHAGDRAEGRYSILKWIRRTEL